MRLLFSEARTDYAHYIFPYVIWAFPDPGEVPADFFNQGFLPASRSLDRFYLCRQVRVDLRQFKPSSENRRVLRKGHGLIATLIPRSKFDYTPQRREFYKTYADVRFGKNVMSYERLDKLFAGIIVSHVLLFTDAQTKDEVGAVILYLEPEKLAFYSYGFYDLNYYNRNLGMHMMTSAVTFFAERGFEFLYLGTCYSQNALYKTQFAGAEFFNGLRWSSNLDELKYLIKREQGELRQHLLESEEYLRLFHSDGLEPLAAASPFRVAPR
jgi:arginyl-tRNA--protein-N-Asp/Glu arginylyltransferase